MDRCSRCVLPRCAPNITFSGEGVCSYCQDYQPYQIQGQIALERLLESQRGRGGKYDCMVTLSGGRDSTYTLLSLVKDYGMRVLAVNYQNPFTDAIAVENINHAVDSLGIDIVRFQLPRDSHVKTFRNSALAWFEHPHGGMVPMVCMSCKTMWWNIIQIARANNVHCIVSGGNPLEYSIFKKQLLGIPRNTGPETTFIRALPTLAAEVIRNRRYLNPSSIPTIVKGYLFGDPYCIGSRLIGASLSRIDLFHYIPWNETEIFNRIRTEMNWDYPRRFHSPWRFDCKIGHLKDYMYMWAAGMTERDDMYSQMVRQGLLNRYEALARLERENQIHYDEIHDLFSMVNVDSERLLTNFEEQFGRISG